MLASRRRTEGESSTETANKKKKPKISSAFLAGAEGLEPTTHGFGVVENANKTLQNLVFCPLLTLFLGNSCVEVVSENY